MDPVIHQFETKTAHLYPCQNPQAPLVLVNMYLEEPEQLLKKCQEANCPAFHLLMVEGIDWNKDLTPWPAKAVFPSQPDFGGQGAAYLEFIEKELIPWAKSQIPQSSACVLAGYSLGGLFSLYAAAQSSFFSYAAAVSPSAWYPGFTSWFATHPVNPAVQAVYLSLGSKEDKTRNPIMKTVLDCLQSVEQDLHQQGIPCVLKINPGNHFQNPDGRVADGLAWLLSRQIFQE